MRVGIDVFTIRELNLDPFQQVEFIKKRGFEGLQYGGVHSLSETLDVGKLREIHANCDANGVYSHVSVSTVNPITSPLGFDGLKASLEREIAAAAEAGWHELHSVINVGSENYTHPIPWRTHIQQAIKLLNQLRPTLEKHGSRINLEDHGETTFDILKVIEATGEHFVGVCLDTANTLCNAEDPVMAARRVAPYCHLTHTKDGLVCFSDKGILRQGKAPGQGSVDFEGVLSELGKYEPGLPLSIEDHKWLFTAEIFDSEWMEKNPYLTTEELGRFVQLAWNAQKKLFAGEIPPVEEYEAIPYLEQMEERLAFGRDYLNGVLDKLKLRG